MIMTIFGRCSHCSSCYTESNECADYENMADNPSSTVLGKDECSYWWYWSLQHTTAQ